MHSSKHSILLDIGYIPFFLSVCVVSIHVYVFAQVCDMWPKVDIERLSWLLSTLLTGGSLLNPELSDLSSLVYVASEGSKL